MAVTRRTLVVDASVVHSAGMADHPQSRCCRDVLKAMLDICHRVVITADISKEWKCHLSRFARTWRKSMVARKKVVWTEGAVIARLDPEAAATERERAALEKDTVLVAAACAAKADGIIITRDDAAAELWGKYGQHFTLPRRIRWVNPVPAGADCLNGL